MAQGQAGFEVPDSWGLAGKVAVVTGGGAVIALTRAMAVDHGPENIRVNCVAPGPVYTPMVYQRGMSRAARDQRRKASALGIEGTGHTLVVDGGTTLTAPARDAGGSGG
jgi:hypothetical protein